MHNWSVSIAVIISVASWVLFDSILGSYMGLVIIGVAAILDDGK